jgi:hypothetical protein
MDPLDLLRKHLEAAWGRKATFVQKVHEVATSRPICI